MDSGKCSKSRSGCRKNTGVRAHFIEEMADVLMYYNDVMLCYDISVEELKEAYLEKHRKNMNRW